MATATAPLNTFLKFRQFAKLEDGKEKDDKPTVWGISTWEEPDSDNECCDYETAVPVYQAWSSKAFKRTKHAGQDPSLGNVRIQHGSEVGGKVTKIEFNDKDKEIWLGSEPISDDIKKQLKQGFYTGYSQGGSYAWRACAVCEGQMPLQQGYNFCETCSKNVPVRYGLKRIAEVSYVDSPATGEGFEHVKANGSTEILKFQKHKENVVMKTKTVAGVKLPASSFAHVGDENETSTWKLPIEFPGDEKKTKCLVGDTPIPLLDGRIVPISEIKEGDCVYSYDLDHRTIAPGRVVACQMTNANAEIVRVVLDSGEYVECTPNHPFMLRNGQYRMAGELVSGDSLMPLYLATNRKGGGKAGLYEQVYQPWYNYWEFTHHMVDREGTGTPLMKGNHVHHVDENKRNNRPENLQQLTKSDHCRITGQTTGPLNVGKAQEGAKRYFATVDGRKAHSDMMKRMHARLAESGETHGSERTRFQAGTVWITNGADSRQVDMSIALPDGWSRGRTMTQSLNHSVVLVEVAGVADVYDLQIEKHENFAIGQGVFVHNTHIRNALARIDQTKGLSADEMASAKAKIHAAAAAHGIDAATDPSKSTKVREMLKAEIDTLAVSRGLEKGMYAVGRAADMLESLSCLWEQSVWEREIEGDDSEVPEELKDLLESFAETFLAMAIEEAKELAAQVKGRTSTGEKAMTEAEIKAQQELEKAAKKSLASHFAKKSAHHEQMADLHEKLADHHEKAAENMEECMGKAATAAGVRKAAKLAALKASGATEEEIKKADTDPDDEGGHVDDHIGDAVVFHKSAAKVNDAFAKKHDKMAEHYGKMAESTDEESAKAVKAECAAVYKAEQDADAVPAVVEKKVPTLDDDIKKAAAAARNSPAYKDAVAAIAQGQLDTELAALKAKTLAPIGTEVDKATADAMLKGIKLVPRDENKDAPLARRTGTDKVVGM